MTGDVVRIRWLQVVVASLGVWAISVVLVGTTIFAYAFGLGWVARGAPDSAAVGRFADSVGPTWGLRLSVALTGVAAFWLARRVRRPIAHGFLIGSAVALVPFLARPTFTARALLGFAALVCAGLCGAWLGQKGSANPVGTSPPRTLA